MANLIFLIACWMTVLAIQLIQGKNVSSACISTNRIILLLIRLILEMLPVILWNGGQFILMNSRLLSGN